MGFLLTTPSSIMTVSPSHCPNRRSPLPGCTKVLPSPVPHLLGTNGVPSAAEAQDIRASIDAVHLDISKLDADIAHAQRVVRQLTKEREALQTYATEHTALLTPARRVPADIWSEIFMHCLPATEALTDSQTIKHANHDELLSFGPRVAPALLLRICKDWTAIALSSPRLWSTIDLRVSSHFLQFTPTLVQTWLKQSRQTPLNVILSNIPTTDAFFQSPPVRKVLEQSHRWRRVDLRLWQASMVVFSTLRDNLPELQDLHLQLENMKDPQFLGSDLFCNAPKLNRVTISSHRPLSYPIADVNLPWAQLTQFSYHAATGESIVALCTLLQSAPNLLKVDWPLSQSMESKMDPSVVVQHSRLRDLSVSMHSNPGSSFDCLSLPSLRNLHIKTAMWFKIWSWEPFESFISRNGQALKSFHLETEAVKGSGLVACLKAMPSLSDLTLNISGRMTDTADIKQILQSLSHTAVNPDLDHLVLLPALSSITVYCVDDLNGGDVGVIFVDMVESRWHASHYSEHVKSGISRMRWASLAIHDRHHSTMDGADQDRLGKLWAKGLPVQVSFVHQSCYH